MRKFRAQNKLKRAAMHVMASMLPDADLREFRKAFIALDRDGDGVFTMEELKESLKRNLFARTGSCDGELLDAQAFAAEQDTEQFTYTEFLAATFDVPLAVKSGLCKAAFSSFDKNKDGSISISELATGKMLGHLEMDEVMETMEALDVDGDYQLDYKEFVQMMQSQEVLVGKSTGEHT